MPREYSASFGCLGVTHLPGAGGGHVAEPVGIAAGELVAQNLKTGRGDAGDQQPACAVEGHGKPGNRQDLQRVSLAAQGDARGGRAVGGGGQLRGSGADDGQTQPGHGAADGGHQTHHDDEHAKGRADGGHEADTEGLLGNLGINAAFLGGLVGRPDEQHRLHGRDDDREAAEEPHDRKVGNLQIVHIVVSPFILSWLLPRAAASDPLSKTA